MPRLAGSALAALFLVGVAALAGTKFAGYKRVEAYQVRPGVLMMPRYSASGQVCEIGLEPLHYSEGLVRLSPGFSRKVIIQVFQQLVPANESGPKAKGPEGELITRVGEGITTTENFQNVSLQIYSRVLSATGKGGVTIENVAAIIRWKRRRCR